MILREVFDLTQEPVKEKEHVFSPDGTGLSMSMKQNLTMVGSTYKLFAAFELTVNPEDNGVALL